MRHLLGIRRSLLPIAAGLLYAPGTLVCLPALQAQNPNAALAAATAFPGCVTAVPNNPDALVLATGSQCLLLSGHFDPKRVLNHEVVLEGIRISAVDLDPDTLKVTRTSNVGPSCSDACTLTPPGGRGAQGGSGGTPLPGAPPSGTSADLARLTGTNLLVTGTRDPEGYGLYSYALVEHAPFPEQLPAVEAFFSALLALPTVGQVAQNVALKRINITEIPVTGSAPASWESLPLPRRVNFVLNHYDYARAAALLASLPHRTGTGPVIVSTLHAVDVSQHPDPVLVEDLTLAQPRLMGSRVEYFVNQVKQDQFWQESSLKLFALNLSKALETAAVGAGMGKAAVASWITFFGHGQ